MLDAAPHPRGRSEVPTARSVLDELQRGAVEQWRVIRALILRETRTRFGKHQLGYLWAFLEPSLFILTFFLVYKFANRNLPAGMDIISFIATGLMPFQAFRNITRRTMGAANSNQALLTYPSVKKLDLVIARFLLEVATFSTIFVVFLGISTYVAPPDRQVDDLLSVVLGMLLAVCLGGGFGVLLSGFAILAPAVEKVANSIMRPLFWISGVFFTANQLPQWAREYLLWNPVLHAVEMIRGGYFPSYDARYANPWYLVMWVLLCAAVGLHFQRFALEREDS